MTYQEFLSSKMVAAHRSGFEVYANQLHQSLKPQQRYGVSWGLDGGCRAWFFSFGLGKTRMQLWAMKLAVEHNSNTDPYGYGLIVCPLGVKQEFREEAAALGMTIHYVRSSDEAAELVRQGERFMMTNYERIRDCGYDLAGVVFASLDEASCLRSVASKTYHEFIKLFRHVRYRFVATATPSPNDYIELLNYASFLDVMDIGQAKTRFFQRNSEKADELTILPHKEEEFWLWVASWALFVTKPSDLGFSDKGYDLPDLQVEWHRIPSPRDGNLIAEEGEVIPLFSESTQSLQEAAREKKASIGVRLGKARQIMEEDPGHYILWHHLEDERHAIERTLPHIKTVYGSQDADTKEALLSAFGHGEISDMATKPEIAGQGGNYQKFCSREIFLGIDYKFNNFIQAIHRIYRFGQTQDCKVHIIYTSAEEGIRRNLEEKWRNHEILLDKMREIIAKYGLSGIAQAEQLRRSMGVEREEVTGKMFTLVHNDCVEEAYTMPDNSIDMILTSVPFAIQYEYTPSYNDFGHNLSNEDFFRQMEYLVPEWLRTLKPGRICAVHVKDRIVFGNFSGLGTPTLYRFSDKVADCLESLGFAFMARITIATDVVRENAQTYRLSWTEKCKDSTKMGAGVPEYMLIFRKLPTDRTRGYADEPVVKSKQDYPRAQWQIDAHGLWRSDSNSLISPEELASLDLKKAMKLFKEEQKTQLYDYERHVAISQALEAAGKLPTGFMVIDPHVIHPDIWTDVVRMRGLNTNQGQKREQQHLCPLPFDIVDRTINLYSAPGEEIWDPFSGIGTVPFRAVKLGRRGRGCELNPYYFKTSVGYCKDAENAVGTPSLFDFMRLEKEGEAA